MLAEADSLIILDFGTLRSLQHMANTSEGTVQIAGANTNPDDNKKLLDQTNRENRDMIGMAHTGGIGI